MKIAYVYNKDIEPYIELAEQQMAQIKENELQFMVIHPEYRKKVPQNFSPATRLRSLHSHPMIPREPLQKNVIMHVGLQMINC